MRIDARRPARSSAEKIDLRPPGPCYTRYSEIPRDHMSEASDTQKHPDPDHIGDAILEEQIDAKLASLSENHRYYQTRILRLERRRLEIHARKRMTRRYQASCYTPDQLAHQLTRELAPASPANGPDLARGFSRNILRAFTERVDRFLLLPELALSDRHLLTHIYCPTRRMLAVYLYPRRLDHANQSTQRPRTIHNPRVIDYATTTVPTGLLGSVIASISQSPITQAGTGGRGASAKSGLHKFIISGDLVGEDELSELQAIHELYAADLFDSGGESL